MQINSIQSNQANFKSGMLFQDAKLVTSRAIDATPAMKNLFVNSKQIVNIRPIENIDPFAFASGYETFIDMVNNMTFAVRYKFNEVLSFWQDAQNSGPADIIDVRKYDHEVTPFLK